MAPRRLYFGHPINMYDTPLEKKLLRSIARQFYDWEIENPNQSKHDRGYALEKEKSGSGMAYFFKKVLPRCQGGIFLPFRDGKYGMGVFGEAVFINDRGYPIWQIDCRGRITMLRLDSIKPLSVKATTKRIRTPDGNRVPY